MTIGSISSQSVSVSRISQLRETGESNRTAASGIRPEPPSGPPPGGGLLDAIAGALSAIGVGESSSEESTQSSSTEDVTQALSAFLQQLMDALHAQSDVDSGETDVAAIEGERPPPPPQGGGPGRLESDLQSLIQELASSDASVSDTGSTSESGLEQSFEDLLSALGASDSADSEATLENFLLALSDKLQDARPLGNVVDTQA